MGLIEVSDTKSGCSHDFALSERNGKVWTVADVLTIFSDGYLGARSAADSHIVAPFGRKQPRSRPPKTEREPNPESKAAPKQRTTGASGRGSRRAARGGGREPVQVDAGQGRRERGTCLN